MTNLNELHKGKWRMIQCINTPKKNSFVVSTVQYKRFGFETLIFKSSRAGKVDDYRAVYSYKCKNAPEARKRHEVMCTLLAQGRYIWVDKHDIYFL